MRVETKVRCVCACVFMFLNQKGKKTTVFWLTQTISDMATYLFVHLNVEPIGHLIVLSNKGDKTLKSHVSRAFCTFHQKHIYTYF